MRHDDYGPADDSRNEREQEASSHGEGIAQEDARGRAKPDDSRCNNEREDELKPLEREIVDSAPEEVREYLAEAMLVKGWSGLLPDPESYSMYPKHVQDKMVAWNDAKILDESKRLDKLVDSSIKQANRENLFSFALNFLFAALAFVSFLATSSPASFGFLAVPGVTIAINGVKILSGKDRYKDEE